MRSYAVVPTNFWNGPLGRKLRAEDSETRIVLLYLMTSPHANMTGLYYIPIPTICHETGIDQEGASKGLRRGIQLDFLSYDDDFELVWVREMATWDLGESLKPNDKRIKAVKTIVDHWRKSPVAKEFLRYYGEAYHLVDKQPSTNEPPRESKGLRRGFEGASEFGAPIPIPIPEPIPIPTPDAPQAASSSRSRSRKAPEFDPLKIDFPPSLKTDKFFSAWRAWADYRRDERRKPLTARSAELQIRKLAELGERKAITSIEQAIANSWTGCVFDDDAKSNNSKASDISRPISPIQENGR